MTDETIEFGPLRLTVNGQDRGGEAYKSPGWFEEYRNPLYADIERVLAPRWAFDIGANYGVTVVFARARFPNARIVAAEPFGALAPYIRKNVEDNAVGAFELFEGLVGDEASDDAGFYVRPTASQDCRVKSPGAGWRRQQTRATTLDALARDVRPGEGVYLKIDTQGYEERVFRGGEAFLGRHRTWVAKSEFAPDWLRSQGSDPLALLAYLTERYVVAEAPARTLFGRGALRDVMARPLASHELGDFLAHVEGQNRNGRGWVDLLLMPRDLHARICSDAGADEAADLRADVAELKSGLRTVTEDLAAMKARDFSLDIVSVLTSARSMLVNGRRGMPTLSAAAKKEAHGHVLLMLVMSGMEADDPGHFAGKSLFEVGTTRERLPDQGSTEKLAIFAAMLGMRFVTIDMDPANTARVTPILPLLNPHSAAVTAQGEVILKKHPGPYDVVYLDAFDFMHPRHTTDRVDRYKKHLGVSISDEACWRMHLECARQIAPKMPAKGVIVIDDTISKPDGSYDRKGKLAVPYLLENGYRVAAQVPNAIALVKDA